MCNYLLRISKLFVKRDEPHEIGRILFFNIYFFFQEQLWIHELSQIIGATPDPTSRTYNASQWYANENDVNACQSSTLGQVISTRDARVYAITVGMRSSSAEGVNTYVGRLSEKKKQTIARPIHSGAR